MCPENVNIWPSFYEKVEKIISSTLLYENMTKYFGFFTKTLGIPIILQEIRKIKIFSQVLTKLSRNC